MMGGVGFAINSARIFWEVLSVSDNYPKVLLTAMMCWEMENTQVSFSNHIPIVFFQQIEGFPPPSLQ